MYVWFTAFVFLCLGQNCSLGNDLYVWGPLSRNECNDLRKMLISTTSERKAQGLGFASVRVECESHKGDKLPPDHIEHWSNGKWELEIKG